MIIRKHAILGAAASLPTTAFTAFPANADDPACKPVFDATTKLFSSPNHTFLTKTAAAQQACAKASDADRGVKR